MRGNIDIELAAALHLRVRNAEASPILNNHKFHMLNKLYRRCHALSLEKGANYLAGRLAEEQSSRGPMPGVRMRRLQLVYTCWK